MAVLVVVPIPADLDSRAGAEMCAAAAAELARRPDATLRCCLELPDQPDLATVDALARLCAVARRHCCAFEIVPVSEELAALLDLLGLSDVLGVARPRSRRDATADRTGGTTARGRGRS